MKRVLKSRTTACVLVLLVAGIGIVFAGDVIVKQGDMDVSGDMDIAGDIVNSGGTVSVGDDLEVDGGTLLWYGLLVSGYTSLQGDVYVSGEVDADELTEHSSFYDTQAYGPALDYVADSSAIITIDEQGKKQYNHQADPVFIQRWVQVQDPNSFTVEQVWDEELQNYVERRVYETHDELHSSMSMKVAWLRQCVYELKQENDTLKTELAAIKVKLGM